MNSSDSIVYPNYKNSLINIPYSVQDIFGISSNRKLSQDSFPYQSKNWDRVIVFLIDGFGMKPWKKYKDHPVLYKLYHKGFFTDLTSIYPSETAAAMTTFHTGLYPKEHGVIGKYIYDNSMDSSFSFFKRNKISGSSDINSEKLNIDSRIYKNLSSVGVDCKYVAPYNHVKYNNTDMYPYTKSNISEAGEKMISTVSDNKDKEYILGYFPQVDSVGHKNKYNSVNYRNTLGQILRTINTVLTNIPNNKETLVLLTADHGQKRTSKYVNLNNLEWLNENLKKHNSGEHIKYSGNYKNVHLHLQDNIVEIKDKFEKQFGAKVFTRNEILNNNLFGSVESSLAFKQRVGDLVVTHPKTCFWYHSEEEFNYTGIHSGMSEDEMKIPFASIPLDEYI